LPTELPNRAAVATLVSATPVTAGCRMIKSAHEIALMRLAAQVTLSAYEAVYHALREGMTQQAGRRLDCCGLWNS
jgi:Xaa-Pro aminopeptidase